MMSLKKRFKSLTGGGDQGSGNSSWKGGRTQIQEKASAGGGELQLVGSGTRRGSL